MADDFDWKAKLLLPVVVGVLIVLLSGTLVVGFGMYTKLELLNAKVDMYMDGQSEKYDALEKRVEKLEDQRKP